MDQTREWIRRAKEGDKEAKDKLVTENTGLVYNVIRGFQGRGYEMQDLFQIGCIGLIKSIDRFDLSYDVKFSTYAVPLITGEIKRFFRDDGMLKVSRKWKEQGYKIGQAKEKLLIELGREPTLTEIEKATGYPVEEVVAALEANYEVESLDKTFQTEGKDVSLIEKVADTYNMEEQITTEMTLKQVYGDLPEREKKLIHLRYFKNQTQTEVAKEFSVSQVQISRMEKKILKKMRDSFLQE